MTPVYVGSMVMPIGRREWVAVLGSLRQAVDEGHRKQGETQHGELLQEPSARTRAAVAVHQPMFGRATPPRVVNNQSVMLATAVTRSVFQAV